MDAEIALVENAFLCHGATNKRYPENYTKNEKRCIRRKGGDMYRYYIKLIYVFCTARSMVIMKCSYMLQLAKV